MIKDKSHIKEAVLYGGLKYDADTTALVVENKKYTDIMILYLCKGVN